jgi:hypothetical protein
VNIKTNIMTGTEINNKLSILVGGRYTEDGLNRVLSQFFDCSVKVVKYQREPEVDEDIPGLDDQFLFLIENKEIGLRVDVDLFYIKDNGNRYYITETCFNHA